MKRKGEAMRQEKEDLRSSYFSRLTKRVKGQIELTIYDLPAEILANILHNLELYGFVIAQYVCKTWREVIRYLFGKSKERPQGDVFRFLASLAYEGRLESLRWAFEHRFPFRISALNQHNERQNGMNQQGRIRKIDPGYDNSTQTIEEIVSHKLCQGSSQISAAAAAGGQIEVLKYLQEIGCPWPSNICCIAARNNHIGLLEWLRDVDHFPLKDDVHQGRRMYEAAAGAGALDTLKWMKENEWPPLEISRHDWSFLLALKAGDLEVLKWFMANGVACRENQDGGFCEQAAAMGRLDLLRWLHEEAGGQLTTPVFMRAVEVKRQGMLQMLNYLHEQGCPWSPEVIESIEDADPTHLANVVRWAQHKGYALPVPREKKKRERRANHYGWGFYLDKNEFFNMMVFNENK